jgi:hypothetical protein
MSRNWASGTGCTSASENHLATYTVQVRNHAHESKGLNSGQLVPSLFQSWGQKGSRVGLCSMHICRTIRQVS